MHIQKDYYICDHCKSEIPRDQIKVVGIPIEYELETRRTGKTFKIELCKDCYEELSSIDGILTLKEKQEAIQLSAERDMYKKLYEDLLEKVTK